MSKYVMLFHFLFLEFENKLYLLNNKNVTNKSHNHQFVKSSDHTTIIYDKKCANYLIFLVKDSQSYKYYYKINK